MTWKGRFSQQLQALFFYYLNVLFLFDIGLGMLV